MIVRLSDNQQIEMIDRLSHMRPAVFSLQETEISAKNGYLRLDEKKDDVP
ncbi:MAG: hypothetical protein IJA58_09370 [Lachnospiraceae bacterium]|nr:hypothetical protein [Lachnospiraceae bacterium]